MLTEGDSDDGAGHKAEPKPGWRKARLPALTKSTSAEDALADIVSGCVEHLRGNERCVLTRSHEEGVHQMRVAVRRLRSCLALFDQFIPEEQRLHLGAELKWLIGELGPARDRDVFVAEILAPVRKQLADEEPLEMLTARVEHSRDEAYERAQAAVGSQRYMGLVLLLGSWAEGRGWRDNGADQQSRLVQSKAHDLAHELLSQIYEGLLAAGSGFANLEAEERHKVRIHMKKLRYATEFFASLYEKRKVVPYLAGMKSLQDELGSSNDVNVARKLLKRVIRGTHGKERAALSYAEGLVIGWHSHLSGARENEIIEAWNRFSARAPYWRTAEEARLQAHPAMGASRSGGGKRTPNKEPAAATAEQPGSASIPTPPQAKPVSRAS